MDKVYVRVLRQHWTGSEQVYGGILMHALQLPANVIPRVGDYFQVLADKPSKPARVVKITWYYRQANSERKGSEDSVSHVDVEVSP